VEAPTGLAGFRSSCASPGTYSQNKQDAQGRWIVRVPVSDEAAVRTLLEGVQTWMREGRIAETSVRVGPDVYRVGVDRADTTEGS
jgi:hypothetical protein